MDIQTLTTLVTMAYHTCAMQRHALTVCGVTFTLTLHRNHNYLSATDGVRTFGISVYDSDSEFAQEATIAELCRSFA
jgi:hypothetical protein